MRTFALREHLQMAHAPRTASEGRGLTTMAFIMARTYTTAELIGGFKAVVSMYAERNGIPCCGLAIGEIKRRATGHGNCGKPDMILACNDYFGVDFSTEGYETSGVDNVADAAWILIRGLEQYAIGVQFDPLPVDLKRVATEDLRQELLTRDRPGDADGNAAGGQDDSCGSGGDPSGGSHHATDG